jgi:DNA-binding CsgD family transcriptional regulator/pimeloyl-ACP methyl ester carboxylesterase
MEAPPVQYVTTNDGYKIAFTVQGDGQPIVFMQPMLSHLVRSTEPGRTSFDLIYAALSSRFRLIRYNQRGQGLSSRGLRESLSLSDYEHDLQELVDYLDLSPFILVGGTGFGHVAVRYTVHHQTRVGALVLWNSAIDMAVFPGSAAAAANWDWFLTTLAMAVTTDASVQKALVDYYRQSMTQSDFLIHTRLLDTSSIQDLLPRLRVPTLVVESAGAMPAVLDSDEGAKLASHISGARFVQIPPTFHQDPRARPAFVQAFEAFFAELAPPIKGIEVSGTNTPDRLSLREVEVLRLIAAGKSNAQIADELVISQNTVIRHVSNIFAKTGVANRAEATSYAHRHGVI